MLVQRTAARSGTVSGPSTNQATAQHARRRRKAATRPKDSKASHAAAARAPRESGAAAGSGSAAEAGGARRVARAKLQAEGAAEKSSQASAAYWAWATATARIAKAWQETPAVERMMMTRSDATQRSGRGSMGKALSFERRISCRMIEVIGR